ncbi:hypothetical protein [Tahibacter caeni]|uniref:hypothetical protein n=1 Tax=Tahibacter caeni TaxID=1453545 RepID=UPI0021483E2F|nr:hypothetical protein [Tahibacter caeni]
MTRSVLSAALALACFGVAGAASAQSLSRSALTPGTQLLQSWTGPLVAQTITQSTATTITAGSISCNGGSPGFLHTDNSYYRAFTLSSFPALTQPQFRVDTINFGVETANDAAGAGQPVTINLWRSTTNPPTLASLTAVSSDNILVPDSATGTVFSANIASQPVFIVATDILVVEIFTPSGQGTNNSFFIGSNASGQSGPSFIRAASCGVNDITDLGTIGFGSMHIVMSVSGNNQVPVTLQSYDVQ